MARAQEAAAPSCRLAGVQIQLCKKSLERLPSGTSAVVTALRERAHTPLVKDCLNRCQRCDLGGLVAVADGTPLAAPTLEALLGDLDALAAEEDQVGD